MMLHLVKVGKKGKLLFVKCLADGVFFFGVKAAKDTAKTIQNVCTAELFKWVSLEIPEMFHLPVSQHTRNWVCYSGPAGPCVFGIHGDNHSKSQLNHKLCLRLQRSTANLGENSLELTWFTRMVKHCWYKMTRWFLNVIPIPFREACTTCSLAKPWLVNYMFQLCSQFLQNPWWQYIGGGSLFIAFLYLFNNILILLSLCVQACSVRTVQHKGGDTFISLPLSTLHSCWESLQLYTCDAVMKAVSPLMCQPQTDSHQFKWKGRKYYESSPSLENSPVTHSYKE